MRKVFKCLRTVEKAYSQVLCRLHSRTRQGWGTRKIKLEDRETIDGDGSQEHSFGDLVLAIPPTNH